MVFSHIIYPCLSCTQERSIALLLWERRLLYVLQTFWRDFGESIHNTDKYPPYWSLLTHNLVVIMALYKYTRVAYNSCNCSTAIMASNSSVDTAVQVEPSPSPALPEKEGMSRWRIVVADYGKGTAHPCIMSLCVLGDAQASPQFSLQCLSSMCVHALHASPG